MDSNMDVFVTSSHTKHTPHDYARVGNAQNEQKIDL